MPSSTDRIVTGVAAGIGAFLGGYLLTYVWKSAAVEETLQGFNFWAGLFGAEPIPVWKAVAWVFYNAHFVRTRLSPSESRNVITAAEGGDWALLYLVPLLLLFFAGAWVAWRWRTRSAGDGARAGATIAAGYVLPALLGVFVTTYTVGDSVVRADPITATLLAGVVYPAVLGGLGGAVAGASRR